MEEKIVNFGVGGMKEVKEEISGSSKSNSRDGKENKEVSHVSTMVVPGCVDLTKDQFRKKMDTMPSPTMTPPLLRQVP